MAEIDLYADENEPEVNLASHIYRVEIPMSQRMGYKTRELPFIYVGVDSTGFANIEPYSAWFGKRFEALTYDERNEVYEWLTEWELAEWRKIGPEDNELFATERLTSDAGRTD